MLVVGTGGSVDVVTVLVVLDEVVALLEVLDVVVAFVVLVVLEDVEVASYERYKKR